MGVLTMTSQPGIFEFAPMLGPTTEVPEASVAWAERIANGIQIHARNLKSDRTRAAWELANRFREIVASKKKPWEIWPEGSPCGTLKEFSLRVTGYSWDTLIGIIVDATGDQQLRREMEAENAKAEVENRGQGTRTDLTSLLGNEVRVRQGNSSSYLLRRLARDHQGIFEAYQRGEYHSVKAAARAAGIVKKPKHTCPNCGHEYRA